MTRGREESRAHAPRAGLALVLATALAAGLAGCARSLAERAVAARGGPLTSLGREVEATVYQEFPGTWRWRIDYRTPDLLRWTLETYGEEQTFAWDGERVRFFLGNALLPPDPAAVVEFRSIVRWTEVTLLGPLDERDRDGAAEVEEIAPDALPAGIVGGLRVRYRDDGATYELLFDDADLLVAARGPVAIPTVGAGELSARFDDFREIRGFVLPYRGSYALEGRPLYDERVLRYAPDDPSLDVASFRRPAPPRAR